MIDQGLTLVLMAGLRATGKTTIAKELSHELNWPVINRDLIKTCLLTASGAMTGEKVEDIVGKLEGLGRQQQWPIVNRSWLKDRLTPDVEMTDYMAGEIAYNLSFELIEYSLKNQISPVILDTGAHLPFILDNAKRITQESGAAIKTIHCTASDKIRCQRLAKREPYPPFMKGKETQSDEENHIRFHTYNLPGDKLCLNTDGSLEDNRITAKAYVLAIAENHNTTAAYAPAPSLYTEELLLAGR